MHRFSGHKAYSILLATLLAMACLDAAAEAEQAGRKPDPQIQLLNNYRKYPDRYIRISDETYRYDESTRTAFHSFTLKNSAGAAYAGIEIRASYLDDGGKSLQSQIIKIPGSLSPYQIKKFKNLKVKNVPAAGSQALLAVATATIGP